MSLTKQKIKLLRQTASRHGRRKSGLFLCEGVRCCSELLRQTPACVQFTAVASRAAEADVNIAALARQCSDLEIPVHFLADDEFAKLTITETPQGIACVGRHREPLPPEIPLPGPFILVLDRIGDPGNLGTILRTAWAVGVKEVWTTKGTADHLAPKAIRAGMGAQFALTIRLTEDMQAARDKLFSLGIKRIWLSDPAAGISCYADEFDLRGSALVIGSEAHGAGDVPGASQVKIPMPGKAESLNAAQAATILMFETVRRNWQ